MRISEVLLIIIHMIINLHSDFMLAVIMATVPERGEGVVSALEWAEGQLCASSTDGFIRSSLISYCLCSA